MTDRQATERDEAGPRTYRERRLAGLFEEALGVEVTSAVADFFDLGGTDVAAAYLLALIAEDMGVELPAGTVRDHPTVRDLSALIARSKTTRSATVVGYGTHLPGPPLFLLITSWQSRLIARHYNEITGRPCYAVQPAGYEGRAAVDRTFERRARRALADIRSVQPDGPLHIAGYSAGSYVAFEIARILRAEGTHADALVMVDMWAPVSTRWRQSWLNIAERWEEVCTYHPERGRYLDARRRAAFVRLNVKESTAHIRWRVRGWTAGIVPRRVKVQGTLFHELTRTMSRSYRPKPLDVDLVVLRADEFGPLSWREKRKEPDLSWHRFTSGRIDVIRMPGNHLTILERDHAGSLAEALARAVELQGANRHAATTNGRARHRGDEDDAEMPVASVRRWKPGSVPTR